MVLQVEIDYRSGNGSAERGRRGKVNIQNILGQELKLWIWKIQLSGVMKEKYVFVSNNTFIHIHTHIYTYTYFFFYTVSHTSVSSTEIQLI